MKLPSEAVRLDGDGNSYVLVVRDGKATQVPVQTGLQGAVTTEIIKGLASGDKVILPGNLIGDGDRVREQPAKAPRGNMPPMPGFTS